MSRWKNTGDPVYKDCYREVPHIQHHSSYAPRDFAISPYFEVVKPTLAHDFDYRGVAWGEDSTALLRRTP